MFSYRRELDGLRALAVVAVIIYHANLKLFGVQLFQGGFFGVDVFFVLSGYLITAIIRYQMEQKSFSFREFYWRRAKRIVPALLVMLLVTSGLAYLVLLPDDLVIYAKSLQSVLYFGSNHFFYGEDSYTAAASIYRPLLHTWSLSVEWQFYVVFPFIIWVINRFFPKYMFGVLLALALVSLQTSSVVVKFNPDMAFYLLPTRAWELILGALATFYNRSNIENSVKGSLASLAFKSLPILGMFLIVHSMIFIGHEVNHPSFITLLPVFGTCLFIMFSHKGELSNDVMSLKPVVGIGLISYSLYLWHQPVFVFFRLVKHDYLRYEQFLLLVVITLIFAVFSYVFVEKVFRKKVISSIARVGLFSSFIVCILISEIFIYDRGIPSRLGELAYLFDELDRNRFYKEDGFKQCSDRTFEEACKYIGEGDKNIVLLGDSHAAMLSEHVYLMTKRRKWTYTNFSSSSCSGIDGYPMSGNRLSAKSRCNNNIPKIASFIEDNDKKLDIIYSIRVDSKFSKDSSLKYKKIITDKLNYWESLGHNIILVYSVPKHNYDVPKQVKDKLTSFSVFSMAKEYENLKIRTPYENYLVQSRHGFEVFDAVTGDGVYRVYPSEIFCSAEWCQGNSATHLYYYDDDHLSIHGAKLLVDEIEVHLL
ncbi:acyltransferase family protein [Vibrio brasiliensis]|uniref:acyltransferase family protein n=1 Tax=Vibrio brasiliensis TaxID=170652 RepID=UPI001EFE64D7|nr:acyltransferase family protein [Vibrio brasiliensis]MCG9723787.1 acyltransferase [Vibrio brasiliensis]